MTTIKRNANGHQNLNDLRRALNADPNHSVYREGGNWIISSLVDNAWRVNPCPYWYTERQAIQKALFGQPEMADEEAYHAKKASK
jgi:hypothetical protein